MSKIKVFRVHRNADYIHACYNLDCGMMREKNSKWCKRCGKNRDRNGVVRFELV